MTPQIIKDGNLVIAVIYKDSCWPQGLKFHSEEKDFLQVATWNYEKGKHLKAHGHKICKRTFERTNELLYIKSGQIKAYFYSEDDKLIVECKLSEGDIVVIYAGGHAYDILEDSTQVLEVKNGPYPGIEKDKKMIER